VSGRLRFLAARLDGLAMTALAGFMAWLVLWGDYWMYLNPRFKPVTLAAAGLLAVLGVYAVRRPVARPSRGRALAYLALAVLAGLTEGGVQRLTERIDSDPFDVRPTLPAPSPGPRPSRMTAGGREYVPINAGELYDIAAKGSDAPAFGRPYVLRGFVHRSPELDARNAFVLFRLAVWCCFADSTAVGFTVRLPEGATPPDDKSWIVAYGHLEEVPAGKRQEITLPGLSFSSVAPAAVLAADRLEAAPLAPEEAYMFEWRQEEPYAY
jgi:uncharacterized repeat protein (TIGR03943 family)